MASLMRWDPFGDMFALPREMERLAEWPRTMLRERRGGEGQMLMPTMDVFSRGDDMVMRVELPGIAEKDIDISVGDDMLTVSGERHEEHETEEEDYLMKESSRGRFERRIALPKGVDPKTIHADLTDGVLEVTVPHAKAIEEPTTHHIAIAGHSTKH